MLICEVCGKEFEQNPHYRRKKQQRYCSDECRKRGFVKYLKTYMKNYWKSHPKQYERNKLLKLSRIQKLRELIINHYGGKCACCGESHPEFMTIDHIDGGGNRLRKTKKSHTSTKEYYRIFKNGFPSNIQILCMNCNFAKRNWAGHRYCPVHHPEEYPEEELTSTTTILP
jgi:hypothetical protein